MVEFCYGFVCFVPLASSEPKFFGFSEFLAGLALMVLAWTMADVSYRFRVATAPIRLRRWTFVVVSTVGILSLLTDLWRAEQWWVPRGSVFTPASWQAFLGALFLMTFLSWAWFAFIRPPVFGRTNAKNFRRALYDFALKGTPAELSVVADELKKSAGKIVEFAPEYKDFVESKTSNKSKELSIVACCADDILMLISERKFCKAIVDSSPATALEVYKAIKTTKKYSIRIEVFSKNIVNYALLNRDSFLFQEVGGYDSGLIGHTKPLSQAMFSDHEMVEKIGSMFELDLWGEHSFETPQWEAYCRIVMMAYEDKVNNNFWGGSRSLWSAGTNIQRAVFDLYKLNGIDDYTLKDDGIKKLKVVVDFIKKLMSVLDKKGVPKHITLKKEGVIGTHFDDVAKLIFEVIHSAGAVQSPWSLCWWLHHNLIWGEIFGGFSHDGDASKVIRHKFRRLIYDQIQFMKKTPNYKGAKFVGYFLNVLGLLPYKLNNKHEKVLRNIIVGWVKEFYADLYIRHPQLALSCLVDGMVYDDQSLRLIKTYPSNALRSKPRKVFLQLRCVKVV